MTIGQNEKALRILQKVYATNTNQPPETYPVSIIKLQLLILEYVCSYFYNTMIKLK